jgi:chromosome segregation ATPase
MSDTTEIEKKSLEAHVELCAERYKLLEHKLVSVETGIEEVRENVENIGTKIDSMSTRRNDQLIGWGIGIIGFLVATVAWMLQQYVLK